MRTIPASKIERRGVSAVDDMIEEGPVHVIKNDQPCDVIMSEDHYRELADVYHEAQMERIRGSIEDVQAGRVKTGTAQDLIDELGLEG